MGDQKELILKANPFASDEAIVFTDLPKQRIFGTRYSSEQFSNVYEKKPNDPFGSSVDCEEGFKAGETYSRLKNMKFKRQILDSIILGPGQFFMSSKKYQTKHDEIFSQYQTICDNIEKTETFKNTLSFKLGQEKFQVHQKEKLCFYALAFSTIGATIAAFYSQNQ